MLIWLQAVWTWCSPRNPRFKSTSHRSHGSHGSLKNHHRKRVKTTAVYGRFIIDFTTLYKHHLKYLMHLVSKSPPFIATLKSAAENMTRHVPWVQCWERLSIGRTTGQLRIKGARVWENIRYLNWKACVSARECEPIIVTELTLMGVYGIYIYIYVWINTNYKLA